MFQIENAQKILGLWNLCVYFEVTIHHVDEERYLRVELKRTQSAGPHHYWPDAPVKKVCR